MNAYSAVACAVSSALDAQFVELPLTPDKVLAIIDQKREGTNDSTEFEYKKPKTIRRALQLYRAHGVMQHLSLGRYRPCSKN